MVASSRALVDLNSLISDCVVALVAHDALRPAVLVALVAYDALRPAVLVRVFATFFLVAMIVTFCSRGILNCFLSSKFGVQSSKCGVVESLPCKGKVI
jgi:hypothetical protein